MSWPAPFTLPPPSGPRMTVEQWQDLPEDDDGELVDGRLEEEEVPDPVHELAVSWLVLILRTWLGSRGFVFTSDLKLVVRPQTGRKPDLCVFLPGRAVPRGARCAFRPTSRSRW